MAKKNQQNDFQNQQNQQCPHGENRNQQNNFQNRQQNNQKNNQQRQNEQF
ncbi:MAG: hypothetical protein HFJ80_06345 [Clostridiales bacterium]|nr:hypothetical protein [Clostridiales bacterium]